MRVTEATQDKNDDLTGLRLAATSFRQDDGTISAHNDQPRLPPGNPNQLLQGNFHWIYHLNKEAKN